MKEHYEIAMGIMLVCQLGTLMLFASASKDAARYARERDEALNRLHTSREREDAWQELVKYWRESNPFALTGTTEKKGNNNDTLN